MHAARKQRTIAAPVTVEGFGFWSGRDVRIEFRPAEPHTGVVFVRTDLERPTRIPALVVHRIETPRRTTLADNGTSVEMVEHILAALAGLQVDNCEVWVNEQEMPGCDGSSKPFVEAIDKAGIVEQQAARAVRFVNNVLRLGNEESWVEARPATDGCMSVSYRLDYGLGNAIGRQTFRTVITPDSFRRELAPCRTFMLREEAEWLVARGLGKRATYQNVLVFDQDGPLENEVLFNDECARHKTLDLVGDLALAGCDLVGQFTAYRSGHRLNAELARAIVNEEKIVEETDRRRSA